MNNHILVEAIFLLELRLKMNNHILVEAIFLLELRLKMNNVYILMNLDQVFVLFKVTWPFMKQIRSLLGTNVENKINYINVY